MAEHVADHELGTADLVDRYGDALASIPVQFRSFGRRARFAGTAVTVKSASNTKPPSSSSKCAVQVTAGPEPLGPFPHVFDSEIGSTLPSGAVSVPSRLND